MRHHSQRRRNREEFSGIPPPLDQVLDLVRLGLEQLVPALAGYLPTFCAEGNTHALTASTSPGDAVVRPESPVIIPEVMVRAVVLVGVEWEDPPHS